MRKILTALVLASLFAFANDQNISAEPMKSESAQGQGQHVSSKHAHHASKKKHKSSKKHGEKKHKSSKKHKHMENKSQEGM